MSVVTYVTFRDLLQTRHEEKYNNIMYSNRIEQISEHDRSAMIDIPEADLKFLLKHYRKSRKGLSKKAAELVRDELMNRNAERNLLGNK